jgi:hypothetical protein
MSADKRTEKVIAPAFFAHIQSTRRLRTDITSLSWLLVAADRQISATGPEKVCAHSGFRGEVRYSV